MEPFFFPAFLILTAVAAFGDDCSPDSQPTVPAGLANAIGDVRRKSVVHRKALRAPPKRITTERELLEEIKSRIRKFDQPIEGFHWAVRSPGLFAGKGPVSPRDPRGVEYARSLADATWDLTGGKHGSVGNGFYMSLDPAATRSFGDEDPLFVQLTFPKGSRFLDLIDDKVEIDVAECRGDTLQSVFADGFESCRKLVTEAMRAAQVDAVIYEYESAYSYCKVPGLSFMVVNPAIIHADNTAVFVEDLPARDDGFNASRRIFNSAFFDSQIARKDAFVDSPWSRLGGAPPEEYRRWLKSRVLGCGDSAIPAEWRKYAKEQMDIRAVNRKEFAATIGELTAIRKEDNAIRNRYAAFLQRVRALEGANGGHLSPLDFRAVSDSVVRSAGERRAMNAAVVDRGKSPARVDVALLGELNRQLTARTANFRTHDYWTSWKTRETAISSSAFDALREVEAAGVDFSREAWDVSKLRLLGTNGAFHPTDLEDVDREILSELVRPIPCEETAPARLDYPEGFTNGPRECANLHLYAGNHSESDRFWRQTLEDMRSGQYRGKWYEPFCWPQGDHADSKATCAVVRSPRPGALAFEVPKILEAMTKRGVDPGDPRKGLQVTMFSTLVQALYSTRPFESENEATMRLLWGRILAPTGFPPVAPDFLMKSDPRLMNFGDLGEQGLARVEKSYRARVRSVLDQMEHCLDFHEGKDSAAGDAEKCAIPK